MLLKPFKIDFLFIYDSYVREVESLMKVKEFLLSKGYSVKIVPNHWKRYYNSWRYSPKVILLPFMYNRFDGCYSIYRSLYPKAQFVNIHSEQISNDDTKVLMLPQDQDAKNVWHTAWGKDFSDSLEDCGVDPRLIKITGNIRFDSLINDRRVEQGVSNDHLLFPSSFGLSMMDESYLNDVARIIPRESLDRQIVFMKKMRKQTFKILYEFALARPEVIVLVRPHPHVRIDIYKSVFLGDIDKANLPDNIRIERQGSIGEFFKVRGKVLAWHSTTVLESILLGKPTSIIAPEPFPDFMHMDYFEYFLTIRNINELLSWWECEEYDDVEVRRYLENKYFKIDGRSTERLCIFLIELAFTVSESNRQFNVKFLLKAIFLDGIKEMLKISKLIFFIKPFYKGIKEDLQDV